MPTIVGASGWYTYDWTWTPGEFMRPAPVVSTSPAAVGDVALLFVLRTGASTQTTVTDWHGTSSSRTPEEFMPWGVPDASWQLVRTVRQSYTSAVVADPFDNQFISQSNVGVCELAVYQRRIQSSGVVSTVLQWPATPRNPTTPPSRQQWAAIVLVTDCGGVGKVSGTADVVTDHAALVTRLRWWGTHNDPDGEGGPAVTPVLDPAVAVEPYIPSYWWAASWFGQSQAGRVRADNTEVPLSNNQFITIELLPQLDPYAPVHVSPAGEIGEGAVEFRARHRPAMPGGRAQAVRMSWTTGGTELWWTGSAWSTSVATMSVAPTADLVVTAQLTAGVSGTVRWRTQSAEDGRWSPGSEPVAVSVVARPVVSDVTLTTTHGDLSPVVQWVAPVEATAFVVRILDEDGGVVWDSGRMVGPDRVLSVPEQPWVNGNQYRAQVTVATASGVQSLPAQSSLAVVSWTPPAPPSIGVSGAVSAECSCGARHALTVVTTGTGVVVERWEGGRWLALGASDGQITDWTARGWTEYRARSIVSRWIVSDWAYSGPVQSTARCGVMVVDGQLLPLRISKEGTRAHPIPTLVRHGTGASYATVSEAAGRGREGSLIVHVQSEADAATVVAALQGRTAVLRMPSDSDVMPGSLLWVRRVGEVPMDRIVQAPHEWRTLGLSWVEQAPPGGDVAPIPAWVEVGP